VWFSVVKISEHSEDITAGTEDPIESIIGRVGTGDWVVGTGEAIGSRLAQMVGVHPENPMEYWSGMRTRPQIEMAEDRL